MSIKRIVASAKKQGGGFYGAVGVSYEDGEATAYTVEKDDTGGKSTCYNPEKQPKGKYLRVGRFREGDDGLGEL